MKHMAVYHLTDKIWLTEIVEDKDLEFSPTKIFMIPQDDSEIPTWRKFHFIALRSKIYTGSVEPYIVHHFGLTDGGDIALQIDFSLDETPSKEN